MPKYRIVFTNGEKRDLTVQADDIEVKDTMFEFSRNDDGYRLVAVIPKDRVLYVVEVKED